mgnify:CR=1 FL=1
MQPLLAFSKICLPVFSKPNLALQRATLQMVNHICDAAISLSEEGIDAMSWSEFVSSIREPELIQYLKERRLYVNEMIAESEEM